MADKTTVVEDIVKAINVPGSTNRTGLVNLIEGRNYTENLDDALVGRAETTPRDLITTMEDKWGLDLTAGPRDADKQDVFDRGINFTNEVLLDIFTSPDSLIGLPAKGVKAISKLSKLDKLIDGFSNIDRVKKLSSAVGSNVPKELVKESMERAATGATLGAMSIQDDDDLSDMIAKITTGATAGTALKPLVKAGAKAGKQLGGQAIDSLVSKANKPVFRKFHEAMAERAKKGKTTTPDTGVTDFSQRVAKAGKKIKPFERAYHVIAKRFDDEFADHLKQAGLNDEQIAGKFQDFHELMERGFEDFTKWRNVMRQQLLDGGEKFHKANKIATEHVDNYMAEKILKATERDPDMFNAVESYYKRNLQLAGIYNREIANRAKSLTGRAHKEMMMKQFHPIRMHTLDFASMADDVDPLLSRIDGTAGARMRLSEVIEGADGKLTPEALREIGAERYARMFLRDQEKIASDMMNELYLNKLNLRGTSMADILSGKLAETSGNKIYVDATRKALDTQDQLLKFLKTGMLATGLSWNKTNYVDNVIKSLIASGPMSALKVGIKIPTDAGFAVADKMTAGTLSRFTGKNTLQKLNGALDPGEAIRNLKAEDEWIMAAGQFDAIDTNKFAEFRKAIDVDKDLGKLLSSGKKNKLMEAIEANKGAVQDKAEILDEMYWNTLGKFGSNMEATTRYIVFKDVAESMAHEYPAFEKVLKEGRLAGTMNLIPSARVRDYSKIPPEKFKEVIETQRALRRASKVVNDTFFDYSDVTEFEKLVMTRIFPFWTFTSKNTGFFIDKAFDAEALPRIIKSQKVFAQSGRLPTEQEREQIPLWMREKGVRIDREGNVIFQSPESSPMDALKVATMSGNPLASTNPILKTPFEILFNKDTFTGREVRPSAERPLVDVPENAITLMPDETLEALDIFRDPESGKLKTNNTASAVAVKLIRDMTPLIKPKMIDEFARGVKKAKFVDKETDPLMITRSALREMIQPTKTRSFTPDEKKRQERLSQRRQADTEAESASEVFRKRTRKRGGRGRKGRKGR
jgi:hypothetical protein